MEFTILNNNKKSKESIKKSKRFLENEHILRYILNITPLELKEINLDMIIQSIDKIEDLTGYKLFNKSLLYNQLTEIPSKDLLLETKKIIYKHVIMQIDFNTIFKSNLNFTFIIKDFIVILYKNQQVDANNILDIKKDLIKNNIDIFPIIYDVYVDKLCDIIMHFINNDIIVKYYCTNIPIPYWKLFELKCNKVNPKYNEKYNEKCRELGFIITGYNKDNSNSILINDCEKKHLPDSVCRIEVLSYISDADDLISYLEIIKKIDEFDKNVQQTDESYICTYINTLINAANIKNTILKFYYIYKIYDFICKIPKFIKIHTFIHKTIINKLNQIIDVIDISKENSSIGMELQLKSPNLYKTLISTLNKTNELIDTIEKTNNGMEIDYI
jgi:hypothetical protein